MQVEYYKLLLLMKIKESGFRRKISQHSLDEGGVVWESEGYEDFESALKALDKGIEAWCKEQGI